MGEDPRVKKKGFEPEKGTYKKSAESVGELYPVLKDEYGIIDGFHRKEDKPDWHEKIVKSGNLKEHYKKMLHANFQRRIVPEEQMKEWINGIAEELIKEGKEPPLGKLIDEELGNVIAYVTLMRYLDSKYKQKRESETLPRDKVVTQNAQTEAEKELGKKLETAKDFERAAKVLKEKAKKLKSPQEKEKERKGILERVKKHRAKKKEEIIEEAKKIIKKDKALRQEMKESIKKVEFEIKNFIKEEPLKGMKYLSKSGVEWCDYGINIYYGCEHNCKYCYARAMYRRFRREPIEAWNKPRKKDIDLNLLKAELRKLEAGKIFFCSITDAYQPINKKEKWARDVLKVLLETKGKFGNLFTVIILTKNASIEEDFDLISRYKNAQVGFTITTLNDEKAKRFEPNSSPPSERIRVLKKAHKLGLITRVSLEPWIPNFTDPFKIVKELHDFVDYWWIGIYNYSGVKLESYQPHVGKLQRLFMELGSNYWFKAELDRIFKSNPILSREEYQKAETQMVGTE